MAAARISCLPAGIITLQRLRPYTIAILSLPLIAGSVLLSTWARSEPHSGACCNQVFFSREAGGNEPPQPRCSDELARRCRAVSRQWQSTLGSGLAAVTHGPFVLVGNLPRPELDHWYADLVRPSVDAMCRAYFDCQVTEPVSILLFADEAAYRRFASGHSGRLPASIYGYYKPASRTVVINLSAGGGTLVHELTHALIDFDFPEAPIWINEGIASLHEECRIRTAHDGPGLVPLDNWRLPILQHAIRTGQLLSTDALITSSFPRENEALCYAQARYVCLFLRHRGLLDDVYRSLRDDPMARVNAVTCFNRILRREGFASLSDFDLQFRQWALARGPRTAQALTTPPPLATSTP
jgi:hypothetical protein